MQYFLGVDGGGTKTKAVVINEQEEIIISHLGKPSNYHNTGINQTKRNLTQIISDLFFKKNIKQKDITFACFTLAGCDCKRDYLILTRAISEIISIKFRVVNDTLAVLFSTTTPPGVALISGTGSNCYATSKNGKEAWAGNWGYFLGDQGSAYYIGKKALEAIFASFDGRGGETALTELILSGLGFNKVIDISEWVYNCDPKVEDIARISIIVEKAAQIDDQIALGLMKQTAKHLAQAVFAAAKKVDIQKEEFEVVMVGGMFKSGAMLIDPLQMYIHKFLPKAKLVFPKRDVEVGSAICAKFFSQGLKLRGYPSY